jgi:adenosylmethionine-8-amino-7-oxononanoate aminotransferase
MLPHIFFNSSGSEANDSALRLIRPVEDYGTAPSECAEALCDKT